ncbi:MAG: V-type ATP synthase subunit K [Planctomycetota bacterium]
MDNWLYFFGQMGGMLALGLAAVGSGLGIGNAGMAAAGAWAREGKENRNLNFTYIILLGMPLSQTLYGFLALNAMAGSMTEAIPAGEFDASLAGMLAGAGIACGLAQLFSAWLQGKVGAAGIRALVENGGKGFAFVIIAMGVAETVGIFGMVFTMMVLP